MPMDKATQVAVGLNNGLPKWWKDATTPRFYPSPTSSAQTDWRGIIADDDEIVWNGRRRA